MDDGRVLHAMNMNPAGDSANHDLRGVVLPWNEVTQAHLDAWQEFASRTDAAPDLYPSWAFALIAAHKVPHEQVFLARIQHGDVVKAVCPLWVHTERRRWVPVTIVEPLLSIYSTHFGLLTDLPAERVVHALFTVLDAHWPRWNVLELRRLEHGSPLEKAFATQAGVRRFDVTQRFGHTPPYLPIRGEWNDFLACKSANFRSNLKRKRRRLEEKGNIQLHCFQATDGFVAAMEAMESIERQSWKERDGTSLTTRAWEQEFYGGLARRSLSDGQMVIFVLSLDDVPIAYDMTVVGGGAGYCLKTSFDGRYAELAPGLVLRTEIMKWAFQAGLNEYDFLGHNERYKLEWATAVRKDVSGTVLNTRTAAGKWLGALQGIRKALANEGTHAAA